MANTLPGTPPTTSAKRPEFRNINALTDLPKYVDTAACRTDGDPVPR